MGFIQSGKNSRWVFRQRPALDSSAMKKSVYFMFRGFTFHPTYIFDRLQRGETQVIRLNTNDGTCSSVLVEIKTYRIVGEASRFQGIQSLF